MHFCSQTLPAESGLKVSHHLLKRYAMQRILARRFSHCVFPVLRFFVRQQRCRHLVEQLPHPAGSTGVPF
ncbi:hypothetical protein SAMN02745124_03828 [Desulfofustis glycolicus DSM 9705]|uniref:Uncharacterized protein n=1 Tax=Desulfofustis glycolicus DSM 9705 TaxID=1121409 RepID=A0A1M5YBT5_9BACT|nr:hypothetical protein SAMN02745124_03828 [Desulfofustis glycolicus DSM 9705]